jgi:UDP-N-acetylmuramyl pentapeptide synthase
MRTIIQTILKYFAKLMLWRYQPNVVAITGSVGKTSTKEAVASVLRKKFTVRQSHGNYNNELGVPLTILGQNSGGHNFFAWLRVLFQAKLNFLWTKYPKFLVLEMGTDKPGDIDYLVKLVGKINIAVLTDIGISHMEFFANQADLAREKLSIIKNLSPEAYAVLNIDNDLIAKNVDLTKAKIITYGLSTSADLRATDYAIIQKNGNWGVNFKINFKGTVVPVFLPNVIGIPPVYSALAAACCGVVMGMNLVDISQALCQFTTPPGRLKIIQGINHTLILDDTYNAAPASVIAALESFGHIASGRKVVVLGTMAELGAAKVDGYKSVAEKIYELKPDELHFVGEDMALIKESLEKFGFAGVIKLYEDSKQAGQAVLESLKPGDTVLVKGSQASRTEKVVKLIMAHPEQAEKLLVRHSKNWLDKP